MKKFLIVLYKIFFIGLLLQFFLQTFVTFELGLDQWRMQYVWLWKEIIIGLLALLSVGLIIKERRWKQPISDKMLGRWTAILIIAIGVTALIHLQILNLDLGTYVLAFKYDFLGFVILLAGLHSSAFIDKEEKQQLLDRYAKVLKRSLLLALVRYAIIFIKPGTLKLFGYDNFIYEGNVGSAPPAAYYTHINRGLTRNQFLFERPISRGFFLTALFPFFFVKFLYKHQLRTSRGRWSIYGINIIFTFSRAAWGAWIIELAILGVILYRKELKMFFRKIIIPLVVVFCGIGYLGYNMIFDREYSNTGHVAMIQQGFQYRTESPLFGWGGSSAGPGSHRESESTLIGKAFNPENQFLQIMVEFGIIGFALWFYVYLMLNLIGIRARKDDETENETSLLMLAMSVGMVGLSASGMVLHSFTDRMIVYPYMLLFGIIWMMHLQVQPEKSLAE